MAGHIVVALPSDMLTDPLIGRGLMPQRADATERAMQPTVPPAVINRAFVSGQHCPKDHGDLRPQEGSGGRNDHDT